MKRNRGYLPSDLEPGCPLCLPDYEDDSSSITHPGQLVRYVLDNQQHGKAVVRQVIVDKEEKKRSTAE